MKIVVVGGHSRDIGKTSVTVGLIRGLKDLNWTAVKITQFGHDVGSHDEEPFLCASTEQPYVLSQELDDAGRGDSSRFLAAGAKRSFWLRVGQAQLHKAMPALRDALGQDEYVIIESNSILDFVVPAVYLMVLDRSRGDFKESARQFLHRANAFVQVESLGTPQNWAGIDAGGLGKKPIFAVSPKSYSSPELCHFVRAALQEHPSECSLPARRDVHP